MAGRAVYWNRKESYYCLYFTLVQFVDLYNTKIKIDFNFNALLKFNMATKFCLNNQVVRKIQQ